MDSICYVYGVVPSGFAAAGDPMGLDGQAVERIAEGDLAALVSKIAGGDYSPENLEQKTGEVDWLAPRAVAHDRVVTRAADSGPVIPFPMWTLFSSESGVRSMLRERGREFSSTLESVAGKREYAVRVFALPARVSEQIGKVRPAIAEIEAEALKASPGQRYLLQKKADGQRENEVRAFLRETAQRCFERLESVSSGAVRHGLPAEAPAGKGRAILYAAFLVADDSLDEFRRELTHLLGEYGATGFDFDFTGPWPPYNFVGTRSGR